MCANPKYYKIIRLIKLNKQGKKKIYIYKQKKAIRNKAFLVKFKIILKPATALYIFIKQCGSGLRVSACCLEFDEIKYTCIQVYTVFKFFILFFHI